eukprot:Plantae.Rhodophyta-Hildenbrandia_rubra.ctg10494.p1 GENE.Plantae.Rhodophyta-Hildenbrandia_rubra.ctg10494~~Plantae.Rhodophyta-Hildenbrandia_rubra.ctg10494.p1  ORF type:complete len:248 (-),score=44.59 Plantae.Rhodophyta-Hildenbrandia_rubra.ctg10494:449-1192(-)
MASEEGPVKWMISRREFRARAHSNPLADSNFLIPASPSSAPWDQIFTIPTTKVDWLDIGCGYGGLLAGLAREYPEKMMVGMEIRERVLMYCKERLKELRGVDEKENGGHNYGNLGFVRLNVMKYLTCWFEKGSLEKMFFCYPDPHFKRAKRRQRIVSRQLLAEYAYVMKDAGVAYIVTDVEDLFSWMVERFEAFPLFERRTKEVENVDPIVPFVRDKTDEAQRVVKGNRPKFSASFIRIPNPPENEN